MKIWISESLNDFYLGGKKPMKRWIQYLCNPFHFDGQVGFMRITFLCFRWGIGS